jgi:hypothetical protein
MLKTFINADPSSSKKYLKIRALHLDLFAVCKKYLKEMVEENFTPDEMLSVLTSSIGDMFFNTVFWFGKEAIAHVEELAIGCIKAAKLAQTDEKYVSLSGN